MLSYEPFLVLLQTKEINFCEQHLKKMFYGDEGLLDEFNYLKKQKPGQSVRD